MAQGRGLPIYLETQGPRNVAIYSSVGFEVIQQYRVGPGTNDDSSSYLSDLFAMLWRGACERSPVSGVRRPVMCESVEMKKACPERKTWACHSGNVLTWDTCIACGVQWRFWMDVIQNKTVITGYHQGGTVKDRTPCRCETCHVIWKERR